MKSSPDVIKQDILAYANKHGLKLSNKDLDKHVQTCIELGHCPCNHDEPPERLDCPCHLVLDDLYVKKWSGCKCHIFIKNDNMVTQ